MLKSSKAVNRKFLESEDFYDEDFEDFDYGDDDYEKDNDEILVTPSVSLTSTAMSATPETVSTENVSNTKTSGLELLSSLESEYDYTEDSSFTQNYDFRLFHEALEDVAHTKRKRFKNGTRSSLTFSNQKVREIERENQILLKKIMKNGPTGGDGMSARGHSGSKERPTVKSASEVNRKKQQNKIEYENRLLKQKLDKISTRRPQL